MGTVIFFFFSVTLKQGGDICFPGNNPDPHPHCYKETNPSFLLQIHRKKSTSFTVEQDSYRWAVQNLLRKVWITRDWGIWHNTFFLLLSISISMPHDPITKTVAFDECVPPIAEQRVRILVPSTNHCRGSPKQQPSTRARHQNPKWKPRLRQMTH